MKPAPERRHRIWPTVLGLLALGTGIVVALLVVSSLGDDGLGPLRRGHRTIPLRAIGSYDPPPGDGTEHDGEARKATDGNPSTAWSTESYRSFAKPGVGLILDAGKKVDIKRLTVRSTTPGFTARVLVVRRPSTDAAFTYRSDEVQVGSKPTVIKIRKGKRFRYYVFWITDLGPHSSVRVNELTAST